MFRLFLLQSLTLSLSIFSCIIFQLYDDNLLMEVNVLQKIGQQWTSACVVIIARAKIVTVLCGLDMVYDQKL